MHDESLELRPKAPPVYLNYASTSFPKCAAALEAMEAINHALPGGARANVLSGGVVERARRVVGALCAVPEEHVYFTSGATLGINQVLFGALRPGGSMVFDNRAHNAVIRAYHNPRMQLSGGGFALYGTDDTPDLRALRDTLSWQPDLVCLTHASNVTGGLYDVAERIQEIRRLSPRSAILVDASQSAGAVPLAEVAAADYVVFPGHKHLHAPPGAAVILACRPLETLIEGGTGRASLRTHALEEGELFAEVGTMNEPAIAALAAGLQYATHRQAEHAAHERALMEALREGTDRLPFLRRVGAARRDMPCLPVMSFATLRGLPEHDWVPWLRAQNIVVRGGLHCSPAVHQQLGLAREGTLRLSMGWATTQEDIAIALQAIEEFADYV